MSKVTVVFDSLDDFKKFLDNPKSVKVGQISMSPEVKSETSKTAVGSTLQALRELNNGHAHVNARRIVFHTLRLQGRRKTKRNIKSVYSALSYLVDRGTISRSQRGMYTVASE